MLTICIFFRIYSAANVGMDFGRIYYIPVSPFFLGAVQHFIRKCEELVIVNGIVRIESNTYRYRQVEVVFGLVVMFFYGVF